MDNLAIKKYVKNKIKKTFVNVPVTIPKIVINQLASELYNEFNALSTKEQERYLFSDELIALLMQKHIETQENR